MLVYAERERAEVYAPVFRRAKKIWREEKLVVGRVGVERRKGEGGLAMK